MKIILKKPDPSQNAVFDSRMHEKEKLEIVKKRYPKASAIFPFWIYPVAGLVTLGVIGGMVLMAHLAFSPHYLVQMGYGKISYILLAPSILIVIAIGAKFGKFFRDFLDR